MDTTTTQIADGIFRFSTWIEQAGLTFNQFLLKADEPLLFHTGPRALFPLVSEAVERIVPVESMRWITFGHVESDECGSMNQWLTAAPGSSVAHGTIGCLVSLNDLCDRPPVDLKDGDVLDLGGLRVRHLDTPHVPHGWEARVLYEEVTGTLLCGDLFTQAGQGPAVTESDPIDPSVAAEDAFGYTALGPHTAPTIRRLAALDPTILAVMHGPTYTGDAAAALAALADVYEARLAAA